MSTRRFPVRATPTTTRLSTALASTLAEMFTPTRLKAFWSLVKRGISGTHRNVSSARLQGYLNEYAWRYNFREADGPAQFGLLIVRACHRLRLMRAEVPAPHSAGHRTPVCESAPGWSRPAVSPAWAPPVADPASGEDTPA